MKNIQNKKWINLLILIIVGVCAVATAYYVGYALNEKKNQEYIKKTYPSMKDLVRMKFERDLYMSSPNQQIFSDPNDMFIFYYVIQSVPESNYILVKVDLNSTANYLTSGYTDLSSYITSTYEFNVEKGNQIFPAGIIGEKFVFSQIPTWVSPPPCSEALGQGILQAINLSQKNLAVETYTLTTEQKKEVDQKTKKCVEEFSTPM